MPRIIVSTVPNFGVGGLGIGAEGKLWWFPVEASILSDFKNMKLPVGTQGADIRPSWATYNLGGRSRKYGVGAWTNPILVDENLRVLRQGIPAPAIVPTVVASAGPGPTGACVGYLRFRDKLGIRIGPLSAPSTLFNLSNQGRTWTLIPTTCVDPSVSHVEGLVSMDGALPRVVWQRELGVTTVVEALATGLLGEAAPDDFTDMPNGIINVIYHNAQWISRNEAYPERIYRSALDEPERYEGLYAQTDGEPIVGAFVSNDILFFGSRSRIYRLTGFTLEDTEREIEKPDIGMVNHHGVALAHGRAIIPSPSQIYLYDGTWHPILTGRTNEWREQYKAHQADYEAAFGIYDPAENIYLFGPVLHDDYNGVYVYWVLDCEQLFPESNTTGAFDALWSVDARSRKDAGMAILTLPGSNQPRRVTGSCDGFLRTENEPLYAGDDGDDFGKTLIIEPAMVFPDPGGNRMDANTFHKLWYYMSAPNAQSNPPQIEVRCGTEKAREKDPDLLQGLADFLDYFDPQTGNDPQFEEAKSEDISILERCSGRGLSLKIKVTFPLDVTFRGYGGTYGPGIATRGKLGQPED
jgi:hypothetical protein